jgi:hypothetical protein
MDDVARDERLTAFLRLVRAGSIGRNAPPAWQEEMRCALSERLVTIGWGGVLKLTYAGEARAAGQLVQPEEGR